MSKGMRTVVAGFIASTLSVLIFISSAFWIANELGYARAPLYNLGRAAWACRPSCR